MNDNKNEKSSREDSELIEKVEGIMGPVPTNANTVNDSTENKKQESSKKQNDNKRFAGNVGEVTKPDQASVDTDSKDSDNEAKSSINLKEADSAVADIARKESDDILRAEDQAKNEDKKLQSDKPSLFSRIFKSKKSYKILAIVLIVIVAGIAIFPVTRYAVLNFFGVRSSASFRVIDNSTQQALKNVKVSIGESNSVTNQEGYVSLDNVRLGDRKIIIERRAFAKKEKSITIGWGSNPLEDIPLEPTGLRYRFSIVDFLSNKPIEKAEVYSGDASAFSDSKGEAVLTLDTKGDSVVEIKIKADGYREESMKDDGKNSEEPSKIAMAPSKKHLFISKRSGKFDVYKISADGKNEEIVLSGTGSEKADMALSTADSGQVAALVSTRDNIRSNDGILLSTLTLIQTDSNKTEPLDSSERIQILGWVGDDLIYVVVDDSKSKDGASTHKIISYDTKSKSKTEIVSGVFLNDADVINERIFYAPAAELMAPDKKDKDPEVDPKTLGLFATDAEGKNKETIIDKEIWSISRQDQDTLALGSGRDWYEYKIGENKVNKLDGAPSEQARLEFVKNQQTNDSLWAEKRDGKGVLMLLSANTNDRRAVVSASGLGSPISWLNNTTAVYRIQTDDEVADYVVNIDGGEPRKLVDATNTSGSENWYYF